MQAFLDPERSLRSLNLEKPPLEPLIKSNKVIKHQSGLIFPADPGEISQGIVAEDRNYQDLNPSSVNAASHPLHLGCFVSPPVRFHARGRIVTFPCSASRTAKVLGTKMGGAVLEPG